jgi:hypothetical protein
MLLKGSFFKSSSLTYCEFVVEVEEEIDGLSVGKDVLGEDVGESVVGYPVG